MNTGIYLRVSTTEQSENGYGLDAQREKCLAYATVKDWSVTAEYVDDLSGRLDESQRPGLAALLRDACGGEIESVIIASLDRLGRSTNIVLDIIDKLDKCGVEIASCKETLDTSTPTGRFVLRMFASIAELDRDNLVERLTAGRNARGKQDGEKGGRLPMGYVRTFTDSKADGAKIDDTTAPLIRDIFQMRETMTLTAIADNLNERGIKTARDGNWHASSVRQILLNESKYRGGRRGESDVRWPVILLD